MRFRVSPPLRHAALAATFVVLACGAASARDPAPSAVQPRGPAGDYPMVLGAPFVVEGVTYTPADTLNYDAVGFAEAAGGEGISGAHRTLPLPSYVEVTSLDTGRTILVRLTQRGPMTGSDLITLSPQAWTQLGASLGARLPVRVRRVNPPEAERALLRAGSQAAPRMDTPPGLLAALKRKLGIAPAVQPPAPTLASISAPQLVTELAKPAVAAPGTKTQAPVTESHATTTTAKPAAPAKAASAAKSLYVQVGAYSTRARAEAAAKATGGAVSPAGKLWRVRVGPHKDRGQADAALAKVRAGGYADARVVAAP